ncbi:MAG: hypothetical protein C5B54_12410 [Acidobacteria bacterium]|nr:MAG: hypothetical protein C5B54_12410 [Acidobacteriota bacterium]
MFPLRMHVKKDPVFFISVTALFFIAVSLTIHLCRSMSEEMAMPGGWSMSMVWMKMPEQTWAGAVAMFLGMWLVMMIAMMLPCLTPTLWHYRGSSGVSAWSTAMIGSGYFFIWTIIGAAAYAAGLFFISLEMRSPRIASFVPMLTGFLVLLAGCFQLTSWKYNYLANCCSPDRCKLTAGGGFSTGMKLGVNCMLCCSGFMVILLVTGVMDLRMMAVLAGAITIERVAPRPRKIALVTGILLVVAGAVLIARALKV